MNTNSITQITNAAPQVQNALTAWHIVALGAGAYLAHTYHSIKAAGGIKNILRGLWDGSAENSPKSNLQSPKSSDANQEAVENPDARKSYIVNRKSSSPTEQMPAAPASQLSTKNSQL